MTDIRSNYPTTSFCPLQITPCQLQDTLASISEAARSKEHSLAVDANSNFRSIKTKMKMARPIIPYSALRSVAHDLARTMEMMEADRPTVYDGEEKWHHNQLYAVSELRDCWIATDAPEDLRDGIERLEAVTGPVQKVFFKSMKRGDNPEKEETCDTVADQFWQIGQGSEFGCCCNYTELTLSRDLCGIDW
jgi:hypothetical protein